MKVDTLVKEHQTARSVQRRGRGGADLVDLRPSAALQRKLMQVAQRADHDEEEPAQLAARGEDDLTQRQALQDEEEPAQAKHIGGFQADAGVTGAQAIQMKNDRPQNQSQGVLQRARYSIEKQVALTVAEKKWKAEKAKDGKEEQSPKKRVIGAMLTSLRDEYPLPSNYVKQQDSNLDDQARGSVFLAQKNEVLDRFSTNTDKDSEVISTRTSIESDKPAGKRKSSSQASEIAKIAPDVKWIGAHLIKREWGGADNMWNVVAWPQAAEDKWADQFESSVDTDGLYGRDPGTVSITVTKEDEAIDEAFIDEVEDYSYQIGLNNRDTASVAKKTGKFKETVAKKRYLLNRAVESVPVNAQGTNRLYTTTLSAGETKYDHAKESAKSSFADAVTDALDDTEELVRNPKDLRPIPKTMKEAEDVESKKRLGDRQKDWKEEKNNYDPEKYTSTNTLFPE